jgi:hypothetical protein
MGTKDRTLRRMPSRSSQRAAIRHNTIGTVGNSERLVGILTQLKILELADKYEPTRRGPPLRRDVPIRLVEFLDEHGYSISTNPTSPTVDQAAEALNLSLDRVVELMHQVKKFASGRVDPQQVRCRLTHRETVSLLQRINVRLSSAQQCHPRKAANRPLVRLGRHRLAPRERQYLAGARSTLIGYGLARGRSACLTALEIVVLLWVAGRLPWADGSAFPGACLKLRRARNFLRRFYRRPGTGRLALDGWSN